MRKKETEHLPIRTFDNSVSEKKILKFAMEFVTPEKNRNGFTVEAHRHDYYHILYVKNGIGEHSIDFKTYEIKPNSIFFISPGQVHSMEIDKNVNAYVLTFSSDFYTLTDKFQKLLDYPFFHSLNNAPVIYLSESNYKIENVIDEMFKEYKSAEKGMENILRALLEVLLVRASRLYTQPSVKEAPSHFTYQLRKLESLIDTNLKEYKLLNDYAEMMHISPKHLNSLCKKGLNKTATNLIHERTLTEAKRLLLFTNNSISEIAYELGFTEKSYFMRFFKKHRTVTADTFRKGNKN